MLTWSRLSPSGVLTTNNTGPSFSHSDPISQMSLILKQAAISVHLPGETFRASLSRVYKIASMSDQTMFSGYVLRVNVDKPLNLALVSAGGKLFVESYSSIKTLPGKYKSVTLYPGSTLEIQFSELGVFSTTVKDS